MSTESNVVLARSVPARSGTAVRVRRGQLVRVTDLHGAQVGDFFAFVETGGRRLASHLSAGHTRAHTSRLFPTVGQDFVTDARTPILRLLDDSSPGRHDMLIPACDHERYRLLGALDHASCVDNMHAALGELGLTSEVVPQPVNLFMHIPVAADERLSWLSAPSRPGDSVTFRSHIDMVVVLSACPQDLVGINGGTPTELLVEILDPTEPNQDGD